MTIFLMVLKKLIKEQLSPLSASLDSKSKTYGHNKILSKEQKDLIDELSDKVVQYLSSGTDEENVKEITQLITDYRSSVQIKRESHGEPKDKGETIGCLNDLVFHISGFHDKLKAFKESGPYDFNLIDKEFKNNPEHIVYYHAVYYFGEEIFCPKSGIDVKLRAEKEKKLGDRLQSLFELIKPSHNLEEQKKRTLQVLGDLAEDNKRTLKKDKSSYTLPYFSFYGVALTLPTDWFSPSEGRLGEQLNLAIRKINEITLEKFEASPENSVSKQKELN
ncbi:hypothetical protein DGG96_05420 [Legionella qingyii]|uniref:Uncharacterized protein n=1 Tax=Legionella qingyii TaxID=2184757 RepID=A0A317U5N3_9GAMM|nr:hypothetical protein [Legionella qingyii]PWY56565.1 hypothetical protein DGG96_05420 [Legionella qingyii]RUR23379.1 hypothetical protein ELY20_07150 [Legionella qingyii]RUR26175.1 hypothetical protein ELY16_08525 [Legionella qingyii]